MQETKRDELRRMVTEFDGTVSVIEMHPKWFTDLLTSVGIADPYLRAKPGGAGHQFMGVDIFETTEVETYRLKGMLNATGAQRTDNNVVRHEYRQLNDVEKTQIGEVKDRAADFILFLQETALYQSGNRDMQLAVDHIEDAAMRAVRAITK